MNLNPFKTFTLTWWQAGFFKAGLLALGIAAGAYWSDFFGGYYAVLIIVAVIGLAYATYAWARQ